MTPQELEARRYSRKCRRLRRQRRKRMVRIGILSAVILVLSIIASMGGCSIKPEATDAPAPTPEPTLEIIVEEKAPEVPQTEAVQEPEPESTPEPVLWRDDIISDGRLLGHDQQEIMQHYCAEYGVPYALGLAMAEVETHFDPDAVSKGGDYGLMQINPVNHGWLMEQGFDVHTYDSNIAAGIWIISGYLNRYGDTEKALMAYNCGATGAKKLWDAGVFETDYTRKVMAAYAHWSSVLED